MRLREVKMGGQKVNHIINNLCLIGCMLCGCDKKAGYRKKKSAKNAPKNCGRQRQFILLSIIWTRTEIRQVLMLILLPRLLKDWATVSNL